MPKRLDLNHAYNDLDLELGLVQDVRLFNKFGYNGDLDTGSEFIVGSFDSVWSPSKTAETLEISSSSANDITGGSGGTQVYLYALDSDYENPGVGGAVQNYPYQYPSEVITLNGTTPVTTTNSYIGVERVAVGVCGSSSMNEGNISIVGSSSGDDYAYIPVGSGITQQSMHYTPAGYSSYIDSILLYAVRSSSNTAARVTFRVMYYDSILNSTYETDRFIINTGISNAVYVRDLHTGAYREKSVVYVIAETNNNNCFAFCKYKGKIVKTSEYSEYNFAI